MTNHRVSILYTRMRVAKLYGMYIMYSYVLYTARLILISGQHTRKRVGLSRCIE